MAVIIARFEVDFAWLLKAVMHERAFKVITTYPFPCMIFSLCRSAGVPIWHVDQIKTPLGTVDIGSSGMRLMSWLHAEGPIQICLHLVTIWLIR